MDNNKGYKMSQAQPLDNPRFADHPEFLPSLTPTSILKMGAFGGHYFGSRASAKFQTHAADLPPEWFDGVLLCNQYDRINNYFGVKCGKDFDWWTQKGLMHVDDPLGWFHWYCRFSMGRRHADDARQIARWSHFRRWETNILHTVPGEINRRLAVRQSLMHWAYNPFI